MKEIQPKPAGLSKPEQRVTKLPPPASSMSRRAFVQQVGAGLLITLAIPVSSVGQGRGRGGGGSTVAARIHIGNNGEVTVLTGKIEMGQGARAELSQAAAEELRVPVSTIRMVMADTRLVPDDGLTAGSRTTPSTVPAVRQGAAAAREVLARLAGRRWGVDPTALQVREGRIHHERSGCSLSYADLAGSEDLAVKFAEAIPSDIELTPTAEWQVMGSSVSRPNRRELVTGEHQFPSDHTRPGMLYGMVLRPPSYGARLLAIGSDRAAALKDVTVVHEDSFVGVAAPSSMRARQALELLRQSARWEPAMHPSSKEIYDYLRNHADGGVPVNPFSETLAGAPKVLRRSYHLAYVQHAPLEPRAALAEWEDGSVTVWAGTQNPFGYHRELQQTFSLSRDQVRVIVPDFGSGFGGKHTGEVAIEAARLARAAKRPVLCRWTREEEFTWAYFRPAAVVEIEASLNLDGALTSWHCVNINSGGSAIDTPYDIPQTQSRFVRSDPPLRQGSYRVLAATANNFARECFMDECATELGADPLAFRLKHLSHPRLRAVLEEAARRFDWPKQAARTDSDIGVGMACGTEKGSYVAACVELALNRRQRQIEVRRVTEVFECGAIVNPKNLLAQVQSCILMGLGPALWEAMRFAEGRMLNPHFESYRVPRFSDVPVLDIHLMDRPDLSSAGGGETPIIAIAPAIANALFRMTGRRVRQMPIQLPTETEA